MTAEQKLTAIQLLIDTGGRFRTDGDVVYGVINILDEETTPCSMEDGLKTEFIDDCTETHGLSDSEALEAYEVYGKDFIYGELSEFWSGWGKNFPNI